MCTSAKARGDCNKRGGRCRGTRCVGARRATYSRQRTGSKRTTK